MRTALLILGIVIAPAVARFSMRWLLKVFVAMPGWSAVAGPWLATAFAAWSFRPPEDPDALYIGFYVWGMLCHVIAAAATSLAIFAGVADRKARKLAEQKDRSE